MPGPMPKQVKSANWSKDAPNLDLTCNFRAAVPSAMSAKRPRKVAKTHTFGEIPGIAVETIKIKPQATVTQVMAFGMFLMKNGFSADSSFSIFHREQTCWVL
mmetsp:Transcript_88713/g.108568  ORF Transcript_88713/g.108568 Transcript_88713/m.108568 type:complete len:102 (-) Transcript_88713:22-327(-)